jgi:hypothetical protein
MATEKETKGNRSGNKDVVTETTVRDHTKRTLTDVIAEASTVRTSVPIGTETATTIATRNTSAGDKEEINSAPVQPIARSVDEDDSVAMRSSGYNAGKKEQQGSMVARKRKKDE